MLRDFVEMGNVFYNIGGPPYSLGNNPYMYTNLIFSSEDIETIGLVGIVFEIRT